ncbi:MAG: potassium channel family protein [Candidatus Micrarchaeia archaeon]
MQKKIYILPIVAFILFISALALLLYEGIQFEIAFIWLLLNSLGINFNILPKSSIDSPNVFAADLIGSFIFALVAIFLASIFFNYINSLELNEKRILKKVKKMKNHIIIAPANSFAEILKSELDAEGIENIIISERKADTDRLIKKKFIVITADPKNKESFELAGIKEASKVIACSDEDIENIMITVAARAANANAKIISRVSNIDNIPKLGTAGAYRMILPEITTGSEIGELLVKKYIENIKM